MLIFVGRGQSITHVHARHTQTFMMESSLGAIHGAVTSASNLPLL